MAVEVELTGNGAWSGGRAALTTYSVSEEATPIDGGDSAGAIGTLRFEVVTEIDTPLLYATGVNLSDESNGNVSATITSLNIGDHVADVSAESILAPLVPERQMQPRTGTLQNMISAIMTENGIDAPLFFDTSLQATTRNVAMQGWYGSAWDWLKMLGAAHGFEITVVGDAIFFREPRTRESSNLTDQSRTMSVERGETAQSIEVVKYINTYKANDMVYPAGGWSEDLEVYSVDADEVVEVEIPVDVSLMSIDQPTCVTFVPKSYSGTSVYAVAGDDGLPIQPQMWADFGGKVEVSIGEDTKTIILKITGPSLQEYAPFTLSINSGATEAYSSLRLQGTGVHFTREVLTFPTGADPLWATADVGVTVDNPTIQTMDQVATLALSTARRYSAPTRSLSVSAQVVNRPLEKGFIRYLTFEDFDSERSDSYTFQSYKDEFAGKTFSQIRTTLREASGATESYENQAFGNVAGSIVLHGEAWYRIRRVTIGPGELSYEAESDTTFAQIKEAHAGMTFADIKAARAGMMFSEVSLMPLRKVT